jgi:hypothetical protein
MLTVISPAKTLDYETPAQTKKFTEPEFLQDAQLLIDELKKLDSQAICSLMSVSQQIGELNQARYRDWHTPFTTDNAKQAVLAFKGDVYTGLAAQTFSEAQLQFAQQHLRILSGLYGLLRPLDLMQPYRLEMGTRFANQRGANLYQFWGDKLSEALNRQLKETASKVLINLASNEYFKAVKARQIDGTIITPVFKDLKNGQYKVISFYAKKARGLMAAYMIREKITDVEQLRNFDSAGYQFDPHSSTAKEWVFTRDTPQ